MTLSYKKRGFLGGEIVKKYWNEVKEQYTKNPKICPHCLKAISYKKKNNKFCSSSCSAYYNQKDGQRKMPEHQKELLSNLYKGKGFGSGR